MDLPQRQGEVGIPWKSENDDIIGPMSPMVLKGVPNRKFFAFVLKRGCLGLLRRYSNSADTVQAATHEKHDRGDRIDPHEACLDSSPTKLLSLKVTDHRDQHTSPM